MKKLFSALFIILLCALLIVPVTAEDSKECSVSILVDTPVFNKKLPTINDMNFSILTVEKKGNTTTTTDDTSNFLISAVWKHDGKDADTASVLGDTYTLEITLEKNGSPVFVFNNNTKIIVNGESLKPEVNFEDDNKKTVILNFVCEKESDDLKVTLGTNGSTDKEYDGTDTELFVWIANKRDDAEYTYEWSLNQFPLKSTDKDTLQIKNVSESGNYVCKVTEKLGNVTKTATVERSIKITPHPVTISIADAVKSVGTSDPDFEFSVTGLIGEDKVIGSPARSKGEDAGTYAITKGTLAIDGETKNYSLTVTEGSLTIKESLGEYSQVSSNISDLSSVVGENNSQIIIEAYLPSIEKNTFFRITDIGDGVKNEVLYHCEKTRYKNLLDVFEVTVVDKNGKEANIAKGTTIIIDIPLTAAEKALDDGAFFVARYDTKDKTFGAQTYEIVEIDGISYVSFEVAKTGVFILTSNTVPVEAPQTEPDEKENSMNWLWVVIVLGAIAAAVIILVCIFMIKPLKKELAHSSIDEAFKEKEKERKEKEDFFEAEVISDEEEKNDDQISDGQKVVSFDDLEDGEEEDSDNK